MPLVILLPGTKIEKINSNVDCQLGGGFTRRLGVNVGVVFALCLFLTTCANLTQWPCVRWAIPIGSSVVQHVVAYCGKNDATCCTAPRDTASGVNAALVRHLDMWEEPSGGW